MLQSKLKSLADECCLAACYYKIYEGVDTTLAGFLNFLADGIRNGYIAGDGYVKDAEKLIGKKIYRSETNDTNIPNIARFYNPKTGISHFVIADNNGKVLWDPLGESRTAKEGFIKDWRIVE